MNRKTLKVICSIDNSYNHLSLRSEYVSIDQKTFDFSDRDI